MDEQFAYTFMTDEYDDDGDGGGGGDGECDWQSTGSMRPDCNWTTTFRSQRTSHMELSATSITVTGPVGESLQDGTKDAPVLDRPALLIETSSWFWRRI